MQDDLLILEDQMDAITLIKKDHRTVESLFEQYKNSNDIGLKFQIAHTICSELTVHTFVEEELLYPTILKSIPNTQQVTEHAVHDHAEAKQVISKILTFSDAQSPEFDKLVMELEKDVSSHVKDEEENILPPLANIVSSDLLLTLAKKIKELKPKAPTTPTVEPEKQVFEKVQERAAQFPVEDRR